MGLRGRHADDVTSASAITGRRKNFTVRVLRGQPSWVAPTLALILLAAGLLYTWNIGYSGLSTYYAAAVKSMAASPGAMFFGALDPSSTITLDKLAGFLIPQVLAVKLFGFHAWALSLPQAIEGVITIFFAYVIGTRWRGSIFGLIVAVVAAFTPMLAAMFGRPMEDGMLTMCQVLAFAALQRAILSQQTRWLMISGAWVAVGFQAKMLQSWLFLPALIVVWLVGSDAPLGRRFRQAAVACAICVLLSVSWMTAIQLVPVSSRPYVDGTTNNNMYSMVFGYNGVDRLIPGIVPGAVPQLGTVHGAGQSSGNTTATSSAGKSKAKLLLPQFTTQIGWLYPLAAAGMVLAATRWRRRGPRRASESVTDLPPPASVRERASWATAVGLAVWLAVAAIVLSAAFVPHATYFAVIALPIALFAVDGVFASLRLFRTARNWRWMILPVLVGVETTWTIAVMLESSPLLRTLVIPAATAGAISIALLVFSHFGHPRALRSLRVAVAAAGVAALVGPVAWSLCVLGPGGGGSASDAFAGPRLAPATASTKRAHNHPHGVVLRLPFDVPTVTSLSDADLTFLRYVDTRNTPRAISFATDSLPIAVAVILQTNEHPIPMGGFSRQAPTPSLAHLQSLVISGRLRFVLLQSSDAPALTPPNPTLRTDRAWVRNHCRGVLSGKFRDNSPRHQTLYDCGRTGATGLQQ